ncbi:hypothetical protein KQ313_13920 [Synechococcus sp. CS-1325]|uniref:CARDB domain-containing protein n=1 Tax=Synechococcus sp. CS-1325 TaxID=2847979 RepID=UPI000DB1C2AB|nr:CARDB domain-containing protein [Synechococcus sp. CS-1325]MCT0200768.1 hypothetical protein [Synechococcus sp. CS-1325]PZU99540.1 MAG: hypothetical protein DCF24_08995 [Cyanobium sp.]
MLNFSIANTVTDLIQGDVREHLPLASIPLEGDVLGLGTTTSLDNGELTFLHDGSEPRTRLYKCAAGDGSIRQLHPGDGSAHFPYVCFSGDATALRHPVDPACLAASEGLPLQQRIGAAISSLSEQGQLAEAPIYGLRLGLEWHSLVITVASKLCMGQKRRNQAPEDPGAAAQGLYGSLQHYRLAADDPGDANDPIRFLGRSLHWDCCGFWDTQPESGRVTVPVATAPLHLHGCSRDLRHGGHLHHEHPGSRLRRLEWLAIYPLQQIRMLGSDLAVEQLSYSNGRLGFQVSNRGELDVSDLGVAVVIDDRYSSHHYLRLPWLAAGETQPFSLPLPLPPGPHQLLVMADPERHVLEPLESQANNAARLTIEL